jgi:hypothetical protein
MTKQIMILAKDPQPPFQIIASLLNDGVYVRVHKIPELHTDAMLCQEIKKAMNSAPSIIWLDTEPCGPESQLAVEHAKETGCLVLQIHESSVVDFES